MKRPPKLVETVSVRIDQTTADILAAYTRDLQRRVGEDFEVYLADGVRDILVPALKRWKKRRAV